MTTRILYFTFKLFESSAFIYLFKWKVFLRQHNFVMFSFLDTFQSDQILAYLKKYVHILQILMVSNDQNSHVLLSY